MVWEMQRIRELLFLKNIYMYIHQYIHCECISIKNQLKGLGNYLPFITRDQDLKYLTDNMLHKIPKIQGLVYSRRSQNMYSTFPLYTSAFFMSWSDTSTSSSGFSSAKSESISFGMSAFGDPGVFTSFTTWPGGAEARFISLKYQISM